MGRSRGTVAVVSLWEGVSLAHCNQGPAITHTHQQTLSQ
jgi:hypothetical protein